MARAKRDDSGMPIPARESKGTMELKRTRRQVFLSAKFSCCGDSLSLTGIWDLHNNVDIPAKRLTWKDTEDGIRRV